MEGGLHDGQALDDAEVFREAGLACEGGLPKSYLFDQSGYLHEFNPVTLKSHLLGFPDCFGEAPSAEPWTISVSLGGIAYLVYEDWQIYEVSLSTLKCRATPFRPGQLGLATGFGVALSRGADENRLFLYGLPAGSDVPILASSDLSTFVLTEVGRGQASPNSPPAYDMQADLLGHLFAFAADGQLFLLDSGTGSVLGTYATGFNRGGNSWAVMSYEQQTYLFSGTAVAIYDPDSRSLRELGSVDTGADVVGASTVPCYGFR